MANYKATIHASYCFTYNAYYKELNTIPCQQIAFFYRRLEQIKQKKIERKSDFLICTSNESQIEISSECNIAENTFNYISINRCKDLKKELIDNVLKNKFHSMCIADSSSLNKCAIKYLKEYSLHLLSMFNHKNINLLYDIIINASSDNNQIRLFKELNYIKMVYSSKLHVYENLKNLLIDSHHGLHIIKENHIANNTSNCLISFDLIFAGKENNNFIKPILLKQLDFINSNEIFACKFHFLNKTYKELTNLLTIDFSKEDPNQIKEINILKSNALMRKDKRIQEFNINNLFKTAFFNLDNLNPNIIEIANNKEISQHLYHDFKRISINYLFDSDFTYFDILFNEIYSFEEDEVVRHTMHQINSAYCNEFPKHNLKDFYNAYHNHINFNISKQLLIDSVYQFYKKYTHGIANNNFLYLGSNISKDMFCKSNDVITEKETSKHISYFIHNEQAKTITKNIMIDEMAAAYKNSLKQLNSLDTINMPKSSFRSLILQDSCEFDLYKRFWVIDNRDFKDFLILPLDYDYQAEPIIENKCVWPDNWHVVYPNDFSNIIDKHPIPFGADLAIDEKAVDIAIMIEMINIFICLWAKFSRAFWGWTGTQAALGMVESVYNFISLETTIEKMEANNTRYSYERVYRWFRWEGEKIALLARNDPENNGNYYVGEFLQNLFNYMEDHHVDTTPIFEAVANMDKYRGLFGKDLNKDIVFMLDKVKGIRHKIIKERVL